MPIDRHDYFQIAPVSLFSKLHIVGCKFRRCSIKPNKTARRYLPSPLSHANSDTRHNNLAFWYTVSLTLHKTRCITLYSSLKSTHCNVLLFFYIEFVQRRDLTQRCIDNSFYFFLTKYILCNYRTSIVIGVCPCATQRYRPCMPVQHENGYLPAPPWATQAAA